MKKNYTLIVVFVSIFSFSFNNNAKLNYGFNVTTASYASVTSGSKNPSSPPSIAWQKSLGGSGNEFFSSFKQTSDGGYIVAGYSNSNDGDVSGNHGGNDYWIVKLSSSGNLQWQKSLGGSGEDDVSNIKQTSDGGYIVAGNSTSNDGDVSGNHGSADVWIVKLNSSGALQWQKSYGGSNYENTSSLSIDTTAGGGCIFAVFTQSNDGDVSGSHGNEDYWIVNLNSTGDIIWQKCLGGTNNEEPTSIRQTSDGGYIVAGATLSVDGDVSGNHGAIDDWIVKLNSNGSIQWQKTLGGTIDDWAYFIDQTTDGGYIIAGSSESNDGDAGGNHGSVDAWIVKLNSNGTIQWQKSLGGSLGEIAYSIRQTSDGGYIVPCESNSNDGDVSGNHGDKDYWIFKLTSNGSLQWQKSLGGSNYDELTHIEQTSDSGYICAGFTRSNDGDVSGKHGGSFNTDCWIVKISSKGDFQWQKCLGGFFDESGAYFIEQTPDGGYIIAGLSASNDGDVSGNHGNGDSWIVKLEPDPLLPLTFLNFSGEIQGKQNLLLWTTASEQNNTGFEVQRSDDANIFSKIGFVNTKAINGDSNGKLDYDFIDENYSKPANYYRLKQIDKDGNFSYSNIVVLKDKNALDTGSIIMYPNPVRNLLNVKIVLSANNKITLIVTDYAGKSIVKKVTQVGNGESIVQLNVASLAAGVYLLKVVSAHGEKVVEKFVKH